MRERVLLSVEDDEADFFLLQLALEDLDIPYVLYRVPEGAAGLAFLRRTDGYENAPRPDLVISNVNMPKKNGLELLAEMNADSSLQSIPVVMFTSGRQTSEKEKALALGASEYITKPHGVDEFVQAIKTACSRLLSDQKTAGMA